MHEMQNLNGCPEDLSCTLVLDFDGTICDSFAAAFEVFRKLSPQFGYKMLTEEDADHLRGMPLQDFFKFVGLSKAKVPFVLHAARKELRTVMPALKPIVGISRAIERLKNKSMEIGILLSNSSGNIKAFLNEHGMNKFDFIDGYSSLFGKARALKRLSKKSKLRGARKLIHVGDEARDVEASHAAKVPSIAVSWGFNSKEVLFAAKPSAIIDHPDDLCATIERIAQKIP